MMRNPEIRRMLLICLPICALITGVVWYLDTVCGIQVCALCLVLLIVYLWDARRRYRRMAQLASDIDAILHGQTGISLAHYTEGEVSLLRSELQKLIVRLKEQADQLKKEKVQLAESMADISHQMRTPLTAMNLLLAELSKQTEDTGRPTVLALRQQAVRMDWLVSTLLKLARLDAGTVHFQPESLPMTTLIAKAAEPLSILMEVKEQELQVQASGSVVCDPAWTAEALSNILKNCTEHMQAGRICVTAEENAVCACICIRDSGGGIDPQDLPHLFERYYRGGNATEQSVGIGLALARSIIAAQNGTVTAANRDGGAEFVVKLFKSVV